ncbi:MAG: dephospho-CoA kinase [Thermodesulfobacteriota bacterium]
MNTSPLVRAASVAVTGGIATGKSRVAACLAELSGAGRLDADAVCRDLLRPDAAGWLALRQAIDPVFFRPDGELDRPRFRQRLFADAAMRERVNGLLHPLAREAMHRQAEAWLAAATYSRLLFEVPLLFEAGWQNDFGKVVVVTAEPEVCIGRLMRRDGVSRQAAMQAIAAQMPLSEKVRLADRVVNNSGDWEATRRQIEEMLPFLWAGPEKNS